MTAPFSIRTPKNVTKRTRTRKSNPTKLVSITEGTGTKPQSEDQDDSMKISPPNKMFLLNTQFEKSISQEVQFYFKSYQEFITSSNQKLIAVISALNAVNIGRYNDLKLKYPGFLLEPPVIDINRLTSVIQSVYPTLVLQYSLGDSMKERPPTSKTTTSENKESVGLFSPNGKNQEKSNEHLRKLHIDQSVEEMNKEISKRGSYQLPDGQGINRRGRSRSPESKTHRDRYRYDVTDRRYRYDNYVNKTDSRDNSTLTASQWMEAKPFLDKIAYFDGSNNKEALNYLAQCKEAAEKMKTSEMTVAWSKLAGRADVIMREESRQQEGIVTLEIFQSMLIEHFYHIPSKERAAKLLNKLQQDPHESIGECVQRGSRIIQVHSGKTNLRDISASQYGWNIVQGLINVSIKNKIANRISHCQSLSDVYKLIRQVR